MKRLLPLLALTLAACAIAPTQPVTQPAMDTTTETAPASTPADLTLVTLNSPSPLIAVKIMVKAGSTSDPVGKEGLAAITAQSLIEGSFGEGASVVTKERLAEITQPWGENAMPEAQVAADTTTIHITVPRDVLTAYVEQVLRPMLTRPNFAPAEVDRIKSEIATQISVARHEDLENLGLSAIESYVLAGTRYQHQAFGTETSIPTITRDDVLAYFRSFYRPENIILGMSTSDAAVTGPVADVVRAMNSGAAVSLRAPERRAPQAVNGREAVVIEEPNAPAAGVHIGFPFELNRSHEDYWPLYVANTWFGTHRDSFGRLYQAIRQDRGYNYGDYSYIEHWDGRTGSLFQIFNQPRQQQYFSVWLRPVQHEYAYPLMKAAAWELDRLVQQGLTAEQVEAAKRKAKVLYVNLGETIDRLLGAKMDDAFYGARSGFLEGYLNSIDAVTAERVNSALRRHLQTQNLKFLVATDTAHARGLVEQIRANLPAYGKNLKEYQLEQVKLPDGKMVWQIPEEKLEMLRQDALWANHPLNIRTVRLVPVSALFRTGEFIAE